VLFSRSFYHPTESKQKQKQKSRIIFYTKRVELETMEQEKLQRADLVLLPIETDNKKLYFSAHRQIS